MPLLGQSPRFVMLGGVSSLTHPSREGFLGCYEKRRQTHPSVVIGPSHCSSANQSPLRLVYVVFPCAVSSTLMHLSPYMQRWKREMVNLLQMGDVLLLQAPQHASPTGACAVCTTVRPPLQCFDCCLPPSAISSAQTSPPTRSSLTGTKKIETSFYHPPCLVPLKVQA